MIGERPHLRVMAGLLAGAALVLLNIPSVGAQTDEADQARARVADLEAQQEELAQLIEDTWVAQVLAEEELAGVEEALRQAESDLWLARSSVEDLAVQMYMDVTTGKNLSLWLADGPERFAAGIGYLDALGVEEEAVWSRYRSVADNLGLQEDRRQSQLEELSVIRSQQESLFSELLLKLEEAQQELALIQTLSADLAESTTTTTTTTTLPPTTTTTISPTTTVSTSTTTTIPPTTTTEPTTTTTTVPPTTTSTSLPPTTTTTTTRPPTTTTTLPPTTTTTTTTTIPPTTTTTQPPPDRDSVKGVCPVDQPHSFVDTWGAPRSGGRTHQGVDLLARRGTPVRAIYDGELFRVAHSGLGGRHIWLRTPWDDEFYYAHLDEFAPGISTGVEVSQGDLIGYVGTTGNSPPNIPHLHFEYHPDGGRAVNPYNLTVEACD